MTQSAASALRNLTGLCQEQKTRLISSIAKDMTTTILIISQEIVNGNLNADNTTPIHDFMSTIYHHERAQLRKMERRVARYRRRARQYRTEKRQARRILADMVRKTKAFILDHKARAEAGAWVLDKQGSRALSESGSGGDATIGLGESSLAE
ncbi:uncharacterized protein BDV14DRAFT_177261 [Aspergillus stella-maris]|uniref:uncharacterized protein n=1 Tax=Aspergillus stella-maris TaxID=1810926 RepID=UPI003CCE2E46